MAYMQSYVAKFGLAKHIECSTRVLSVSRTRDGLHVVKILKQTTAPGTDSCQWNNESWECDAVVVCSGLNVHPNIPDIAGLPPMAAKSDALTMVGSSPNNKMPTLTTDSANPGPSTLAPTRTHTSSTAPRL